MPKAIGLYFELIRDGRSIARAETIGDVNLLLMCIYPSSNAPLPPAPVEVRPCIQWKGTRLPPMGFLPPDRPEKPPLHL